jgi:hypothetical protein
MLLVLKYPNKHEGEAQISTNIPSTVATAVIVAKVGNTHFLTEKKTNKNFRGFAQKLKFTYFGIFLEHNKDLPNV